MDNAVRKTGPKRLRKTRRELPYGQVSLWGKSVNLKAIRDKKRDRALRY